MWGWQVYVIYVLWYFYLYMWSNETIALADNCTNLKKQRGIHLAIRSISLVTDSFNDGEWFLQVNVNQYRHLIRFSNVALLITYKQCFYWKHLFLYNFTVLNDVRVLTFLGQFFCLACARQHALSLLFTLFRHGLVLFGCCCLFWPHCNWLLQTGRKVQGVCVCVCVCTWV